MDNVSLRFQANAPLKALNTFGMDVHAAHYCELNTLADLPALLTSAPYRQGPVLWLGGGSNLLFTQDYPGLVVRVGLKGTRLVSTSSDAVVVEAAAGENWHQWVETTLHNGWYGLENLSLIPGSVGACPVQNIGAYGVEVKDHISEVVCADLHNNGQTVVLSAAECAFGYRDSLFKHQGAGRYLVTAVRFRLTLTPALKTGYGDIQHELAQMPSWPEPSALDVSRAVVTIRSAKLPNPRELGNAGSFFKNPLVTTAQAEILCASHPGLPCYPAGAGRSKLAAGWMIDQCGFKGYRLNDAGVHSRQALVLVNYGQANGSEIRALAEKIQATILERYGVVLEAEPIIL
jgi:UDP-N-acetylmuramate dehydrogenase